MALLNILSALSALAGGAAASMQLGSITLVGAETPSRLERTGKMQTVTHRLVGGERRRSSVRLSGARERAA